MFRAVLIACVVVAALAINPGLDSSWESFKVTHKKQYGQEEEKLRRIIWEDNLKYISSHNRRADRGQHTFWLGENEYADMTIDEFVQVMNGFKMNASRGRCSNYMPPSHVSLPDQVDWRTEGYVTEVKNQGHCGSCWSFSTTGSLEGQHFKSSGKLVSLSEQNLMDCSKRYGNKGCEGGLMDNAFAYIIANDGIDTEESYPYTAKDGFFCRYSERNIGATEKSCMDIRQMSESDLQSAVATVGPISVAIDAGHKSFQLYKSGVYEEPACSSTKLDHGVLAVGYGSESEQEYWIVKNSWGASWGMSGYVKMARNHRNMCGIATQASFPVV